MFLISTFCLRVRKETIETQVVEFWGSKKIKCQEKLIIYVFERTSSEQELLKAPAGISGSRACGGTLSRNEAAFFVSV